MRGLGLAIVFLAAVVASGSHLARSPLVTVARHFTRTCTLRIAASLVAKDPLDLARRPPPLRVEASVAVLARDAARPTSPEGAASRPAAPPAAEPAILALPFSRDLASVMAEAGRNRRNPCSVIAGVTGAVGSGASPSAG